MKKIILGLCLINIFSNNFSFATESNISENLSQQKESLNEKSYVSKRDFYKQHLLIKKLSEQQAKIIDRITKDDEKQKVVQLVQNFNNNQPKRSVLKKVFTVAKTLTCTVALTAVVIATAVFTIKNTMNIQTTMQILNQLRNEQIRANNLEKAKTLYNVISFMWNSLTGTKYIF